MDLPGVSGLTEIGRGGTATVYRAVQTAFGRTVAVKVLERPVRTERERAEFERECRAVGSLSGHRGIVTVYDAGTTEGGRPYLIMEHLPSSLAQLVEDRGALPLPEAVGYALQLADALGAAHRLGVLHRDVKPENVLLDEGGTAKLADFGLARIADGYESRTNSVKATVAHAAPEILDGGPATVRADVYSLASTLYQLLTGAPPFVRPTDESLVPILRRILTEEPPPLAGADVPPAVASVVHRGLAKDPEERPESVEAWAAELRGALDAAVAATVSARLPDPLPLAATADPNRATVGSGGRRHHRRTLVAVGPLLALLALGGVAAAAMTDDDGELTPTQGGVTAAGRSSVVGAGGATIPDVVGMTLEEAEVALEGSGARIVVEEVGDDEVPAGTVISQSATYVTAGGPVTLIVSAGPDDVALPTLTGLDGAAAEAALAAAGLLVGERVGDPARPVVGVAIDGADIAAGEAIAPGTAVDLTFAGEELIADVDQTATSAPRPGPATPRTSTSAARQMTPTTAPGTSASTAPPTTAPPVATTPTTAPPTTVTTAAPSGVQLPNFVGWSRDAARDWLAGQGLIYGQRVTGSAPGFTVYQVVSQSHAAGSTVPLGTRVWLTSLDEAYCSTNPGDCV